MATSHTEPFVMVDRDAPTSAATPLPAYENTQTFTIGYTASDGNGTGLGNITLWVRTGGGGWSAYATQPAGNLGQFTFTASDRKSTRLNSSHVRISYAVFCLKKKTKHILDQTATLMSDDC